MDVRRSVLDEDSKRPGEHEQRRQPEGHPRRVPRHPVRINAGNHVVPEVHVPQLHPLPSFHVVVQTFCFGEEPGPLVEVVILWAGLREAEALGEAQAGGGVTLQARKFPRHVFHSTVGVVKLPFRHVGVDPLVVHLRGGVGIPIAVPCHLPRPSDKVVADGLPPYARLCLSHA